MVDLSMVVSWFVVAVIGKHVLQWYADSNKNMKYKVIFFDADGVMLKGVYKFTDKLAEKYGLRMEAMLPFFLGPFKQCAMGKADAKEELGKVIKDWGWDGTVDELMDFWLSEGTEFDKENIELVRKLSEKGVHCFVSTGQEAYRGSYLRKSLGDNKPFEDVFFTAEIGCDKKDQKFMETIFSRVAHITENKSEILLIDDTENIIELAKSFGFDTIFYQSPADINELREYVQ
jgi:putative hydrolase of the HAD superfamily